MGERIKSEMTGQEYDIKNVVRILNQRQCAFYTTKSIYPIDMYQSIDQKNGKPLLVYIYLKTSELKQAYEEWCKRKETQDDE